MQIIGIVVIVLIAIVLGKQIKKKTMNGYSIAALVLALIAIAGLCMIPIWPSRGPALVVTELTLGAAWYGMIICGIVGAVKARRSPAEQSGAKGVNLLIFLIFGIMALFAIIFFLGFRG